MAKILVMNKGVEESVSYLLKHLMESGKVKGVFALSQLTENKSGQAISYSLITGKKAIKNVNALYPIMPRNGGALVSFLTHKGSVPGDVAIVIRPCESRAFLELIKRNRGNMENLFIISSTCGGIYPTKMSVNGGLADALPNYWQAIKNNKVPEGLRSACLGCTEFVPYNADMTIMTVGGGNIESECQIVLNSTKAEEFANDNKLDGKIKEQDLPLELFDSVRKTREVQKKEQTKEMGVGSLNLKGMVNLFGKCITCRGCRTACPICYCELCTFDSQIGQSKPSLKELNRKGGTRTPPGTVYYHMTRLSHVSISCVGCGSCEDACPSEIPLSMIYRKVGEDVQKVFNYLPGKNLDEEIPIRTFELDEFTEVED
jgi:formate dehydrogenase subunit beta